MQKERWKKGKNAKKTPSCEFQQTGLYIFIAVWLVICIFQAFIS